MTKSFILCPLESAKHITRVIILDVSKAFDKGWHRELLHKFSNYYISFLKIIKLFLSDRSMKDGP